MVGFHNARCAKHFPQLANESIRYVSLQGLFNRIVKETNWINHAMKQKKHISQLATGSALQVICTAATIYVVPPQTYARLASCENQTPVCID